MAAKKISSKKSSRDQEKEIRIPLPSSTNDSSSATLRDSHTILPSKLSIHEFHRLGRAIKALNEAKSPEKIMNNQHDPSNVQGMNLRKFSARYRLPRCSLK